jgi:hypothetical protein
VALTALTRRTPKPKARSRPPQRFDTAEPLTAGALYDIALHGAALYVEKQNAQDIRRLIQPWQARSMSYYDLVPEIKMAARFFAQMLMKVRMFPAMIDPDTHEPEELHEGPVFDAFQRIKDRSGSREQLQQSYAIQKFLIGETYLTVSPDEEREEVWECLSPNELRVQPGGIASRFRAPMLSADTFLIGNDEANDGEGPQFTETGPDIINVYRLWRQHPAYTWLADCHMQAVIDLCEELVLSTYSVRSQLKSRLNQAGILWVPDEISFTSLGNNPEEDPNSYQFQERLSQTMMAAISDPGSAAAIVPILARVAADFIGKIQYTKFNDSTGDLTEINQRSEMISRLATGLELPKAVIAGIETANHWTGWLVDEETWKSYGLPASLEMAADFNAAYLQPTARVENVPDWENVCIGIDPSEVINHPDRAKDADALYTGRAISKKVWRESKGYNDNDEMPRDEINEMLGVQIRDGSLAVYGIPGVRGGAIEPEPGVIENPGGESTSAVTPGATGADAERAAPSGGPEGADGGPGLQASAAPREQQILGAAQFAIKRGRSLAGSRIRTLTSPRGPKDARCVECQKAINGVPNWNVAATLGHEQCAGLNGDSTNLVEGVGLEFAEVLVDMGVSAAWATELGELVEQHTERTLYDLEPAGLPAAFATLLSRIDLPLERAT